MVERGKFKSLRASGLRKNLHTLETQLGVLQGIS